MKNVLFVCMDNFGRSIIAEYCLRYYLKKNNISDITVSSAGITANADDTNFSRVHFEELKKLGIDATDFKRTQLTQELMNKYDVIIPMSNEHKDWIKAHFGKNLPTFNEIYKNTNDEITVSDSKWGDTTDDRMRAIVRYIYDAMPVIAQKIIKEENGKAVSGISPSLFADVAKTSGQVFSIVDIIKSIFLLIIFAGFFGYLTYVKILSIYIGTIFISFAFLMLIISLVYKKRVDSVDLGVPAIFDAQNNVSIAPDEKLENYVGGITKTGMGVRSVEFLGKGEVLTPENALLITNKQFIFIVVPVPGADKTVGGADPSLYQFMFSGKQINQKLQNLIATMPLEKIIKSHVKNYALPRSETKLSFSNPPFDNFDFYRNNERISYTIMDQKEYNRIKTLYGAK